MEKVKKFLIGTLTSLLIFSGFIVNHQVEGKKEIAASISVLSDEKDPGSMH
jgi:hypothetical protein